MKSVRRKSKSKVRIPLKKGGLLGYSLSKNLKDRRKILSKLSNKYGCGNIIKKLNVLYIFNKNNHPLNARMFKSDMKYVQSIRDKKLKSPRKSSKRKKSK